MKFSDIPVPEAYKESADFRFFMKWFELALSQIKFDTENLFDLYDPQRCPSSLLWLLADTMGYKFDDRLPVAFNRLVLLYFMSMIRHKGSKTGVTLAAEVNLAQFSIDAYGQDNPIMYDRLEDTSIPVNSAYVTPHPEQGYIDIVYFSAVDPVDACVEYVRPIGMYCFQHSGVRVDARTKLSVDARLTNMEDLAISVGPTHVGHYRREDYASLQKTVSVKVPVSKEIGEQSGGRYLKDKDGNYYRYDERVSPQYGRNKAYYRNKDHEGEASPYINPGYRSLYSLQLANNEHIVKALIPEKETGDLVERDPIFSLGYQPQDVSVVLPDSYLTDKEQFLYNLRYDKALEESITSGVQTLDTNRAQTTVRPYPAVNPPMASLGDAVSLDADNTQYSKLTKSGIKKVDVT